MSALEDLPRSPWTPQMNWASRHRDPPLTGGAGDFLTHVAGEYRAAGGGARGVGAAIRNAVIGPAAASVANAGKTVAGTVQEYGYPPAKGFTQGLLGIEPGPATRGDGTLGQYGQASDFFAGATPITLQNPMQTATPGVRNIGRYGGQTVYRGPGNRFSDEANLATLTGGPAAPLPVRAGEAGFGNP